MNKRTKIVKLRQEGLTIREIQQRMKMSSPSLVAYYLDQEKEPLFRVPKTKLVAALRQYHRFLETLRANAASSENGIGKVTVELLDELVSQFPMPRS